MSSIQIGAAQARAAIAAPAAEAADALRVLHVTPFFAPAWGYGGIPEAAWQFSRHLARAGASVRVLTTDANGAGRLSVAERAGYAGAERFEARYCRRAGGDSVSVEMLGALWAQVRWADVVHIHAAYSFPTMPALLAARVIGRPVVWTPHGALQRWRGSRRVGLKRVWDRMCLLIAPRRLVIHATSETEAAEIRGRIKGAAISIVPNGVEIPERISRAPRGDVLRLGFIGRLDPKKGIENLLAACRRLKDGGRVRFGLEIAGSGTREYENRLRGEIARLGLEREVTLVGALRGAAKEALLARTEVVVAPSFTENFAIVVAEAMAAGAAVIASTGTPWSEIEQRGAGLWVDNDPGSLATAIEKLSAMPIGEMGARGRRWMQERFAWEICTAELMRVYRTICADQNAAVLAAAHQS